MGKGIVFPRPSKKVADKDTGKTRRAPLRKGERWTDPDSGRTVKAGPQGSTWSWQFVTGSRKAGTRKTHEQGGFRTKKDAEADLAATLAKVGQGDKRVLVRPSEQPLGEYLTGWLDARADLKPTTRNGYRSVIDAWIVPNVGTVALADVDNDVLTGLYSTLRSHGGRKTKAHPNGRPLGSRSVQSVHVLLHMALADAAESGSLQLNPVDQLPKRQRPKHRNRRQAEKYWEAEEAAKFLAAVADDRWYPFWALMLDTGMRRGEMCGLRWDAVNLLTGVATVRRSRVHAGAGVIVDQDSTKNDRTRVVELDDRTVDALNGWRKRLAAEKLAAGPAWCGDLEAGHVFVDETGLPPRPDSFNTAFDRARQPLGLPDLSPHGLRHTAATIALDRGAPPHVVQDRLGHADFSITLGLYAHKMASQGAEVAKGIGDAVYGTG